MYIYIHVRALLRWPTAGRNEIHRHTFYDCCMLFPSLSFFVKIWPSKGRIGKHKRSRKKKLGFAVCWYIAFYIYYTRSRPADNPISSTKRSIILFIHSFIHRPMCVWLYIYWFLFLSFFLCCCYCCELLPKKAVRPKCSSRRSASPYMRVFVCVCRCVSACVQSRQ